ncbi:CpaD family pilus assembly lipoprotein [Phenylobacterium soli]|nr:CpaD family pilus assembly lipoprotein [Phenylobacterium soli]
MIASRTTLRRAALTATVAGLALSLGACAENSKVLSEHVQAAPPVCTSNPAGPSLAAPMLGCANKANLAAMVADPADLVRGRAETPALGNREAVAVENLKKGPDKKVLAVPTTTLLTTNTSTSGGN